MWFIITCFFLLLQKRLTDEIAAAESENKHIQSEVSISLFALLQDSLDILKTTLTRNNMEVETVTDCINSD